MTIKSNTPAHDKDCWQTPLWLFDALDIEFGFWLDSAASDKNALCAHWLTEADNALNSEWISHGAIWNNPPYSNIRPWVEKAAEQCIQQRQTVVMLVPEDMSVGWFSKALESVDEVRIITDAFTKTVIDATMCAIIAWFIRDLLDFAGLSSNLAYITSVFIGYIGTDSIGSLIKRFAAKKAGVEDGGNQ